MKYDWRNIVEILGVVSIVGSLIFVGLELNQAQQVALSESGYYIVESGIENGRGNFSTAKKIASQAHKYFEDNPNAFLVEAGIEVAKADMSQGNLKSAESNIDELLQLSHKLSLVENTYRLMNMQVDLLIATKDYKGAIEIVEGMEVLRDTLTKREKQRAILILDQEYQTAQREQQIELLRLENDLKDANLAKSRSAQVVIIIGASTVILILAIFFYYRNRKLVADREAQELRADALHKRLVDLNVRTSDLELDLEKINDKLNTPLSEREFEALKLSMEGKTNSEISEHLFVTVSTVKFHLRNTYAKLGVSNRKEALAYVSKSE